MMYTQEQYDALLAVCRSYRQDVERLEEVIANQNNLCWNCKKSVKEFAEKLKKQITNTMYCRDGYIDYDDTMEVIDELLKEYEK